MILKKILTKLSNFKKQIEFNLFENNIMDQTWSRHNETLLWAEEQSKVDEKYLSNAIQNSESILVQRGYQFREKVLREFSNKYKDDKDLRILVHIPDKKWSPGGFSLFSNLAQSLNFIGIQVETVIVGNKIEAIFNTFQPTVFISSDHKSYLETIDWDFVNQYRQHYPLKIGLTASIEAYGNTPLIPRLKWARQKGIDFYYSFRAPEYFESRADYKPFFEYGYDIISVEFGANPLVYFPVPDIECDFDYIFLASSNADKQKRYFQWLPKIVQNYIGFIDGPGWSKISRWAKQSTHRYLYARAKIGINLHIDDSLDWASELNERTYILAACGIPQLIDNAKLLPYRFSQETMFIANSPEEYSNMFAYMLKNPEECHKRALKALEEVFENHTTLHRAEKFVLKLYEIGKLQ